MRGKFNMPGVGEFNPYCFNEARALCAGSFTVAEQTPPADTWLQ